MEVNSSPQTLINSQESICFSTDSFVLYSDIAHYCTLTVSRSVQLWMKDGFLISWRKIAGGV